MSPIGGERQGAMIVPPATIGVLGGGQLGRYTVMAARTMGYRTLVLDPDPSAPAGRVADDHLIAAYDDAAALARLEIDCDVVTTEFENPPATAVERLASRVLVAPAPTAFAVAQDRIAEKAFLVDNGFPVGPHQVIDDAGVPIQVALPGVLKTARLGYDGKGQRRVADPAEAMAAWADLGGVACVLEHHLELDAEVSVVVARTVDARTAIYEVTENVHVDGVLDLSVAPARVADVVADRAAGIALALADALDFVGVLAVELFVVGGDVLVNELAPRPHNSGHWTLDAARTSQFAQQVRAVCGLALGPTAMSAPAVAMVNLLGDLWDRGEPRWEAVLDEPDVALHLYGKAAARPGRKMGHLTVTGANPGVAAERALELRRGVSRRG